MRRSLLIAAGAVAFVTSGACGLGPLVGGKLYTTPPPWATATGPVYKTFAEAKRACTASGRGTIGFSSGQYYGWACSDSPPRAAPPAQTPQGPK
jgi:hypothetical protein